MKSTVTIINGMCTIELRAENEFEKTMIEDFEKQENGKVVECRPRTDTTQYGQGKTNHRIYIDITNKPVEAVHNEL